MTRTRIFSVWNFQKICFFKQLQYWDITDKDSTEVLFSRLRALKFSKILTLQYFTWNHPQKCRLLV